MWIGSVEMGPLGELLVYSLFLIEEQFIKKPWFLVCIPISTYLSCFFLSETTEHPCAQFVLENLLYPPLSAS
jgi:hypothetical protein